MLTSRKFYEFGGNIDAVRRVVDCLTATRAYVVFIPAIAIEFVLFTSMSKVCYVNSRPHTTTWPDVLTVLHARIIFDSRPHQSTHKTLRYPRPYPKVQIGPVRTP